MPIYKYGPLVREFKTPPFHGGNTGSNPVRTIYWRITQVRLEGNGLENRQACKSVRGFRIPHPPFYINAGWSSSVARRAHNPKVVGSNPAPAIWLGSSVGRAMD